jgi:hypothetical protein
MGASIVGGDGYMVQLFSRGSRPQLIGWAFVESDTRIGEDGKFKLSGLLMPGGLDKVGLQELVKSRKSMGNVKLELVTPSAATALGLFQLSGGTEATFVPGMAPIYSPFTSISLAGGMGRLSVGVRWEQSLLNRRQSPVFSARYDLPQFMDNMNLYIEANRITPGMNKFSPAYNLNAGIRVGL